MALSKLFLTKQEIIEQENKLQVQLELASANILTDIHEAICNIKEYTTELQKSINESLTDSNEDKPTIILRENCSMLTYFCQCMERLLLFGFKKKFFGASLWDFICDAKSVIDAEVSEQWETDINLIKSIIELRTDIGMARAFLRQSLRSKSISTYFKLISKQTNIIQKYYLEHAIISQENPSRINELLNDLNALPKTIGFEMLLSDTSLNTDEYFTLDEYDIPQWIVDKHHTYDIPKMVDMWLKQNYGYGKHKYKHKYKHKTKYKHKHHRQRVGSLDDNDDVKVQNQLKKKKKRKDKKRARKRSATTTTNTNTNANAPANVTANIHRQRSLSLNETSSSHQPLIIISTVHDANDATKKNLNMDTINMDDELSKWKTEQKDIDRDEITVLQSKLDTIQMERNELQQQVIQQQNEISNLKHELEQKGKSVNDLESVHEVHSFHVEHDEKYNETSWKSKLKKGDKIDYKLERIWVTATIVSCDANNRNRFRIGLDGWNSSKDEIVVDIHDENVGPYRSCSNIMNYNNDNTIFEGWMEKEGGNWKTWKKRYFMLDYQGNIRYYRQKGDKEFMNEFNVKWSDTKIEKDKKCFSLSTGARNWKFCCKNDRDLIKWIHAINFAKQVNSILIID